MSLLPPSLEELIPAHHLVRMVNQVVEDLGPEPLLTKHKALEEQPNREVVLGTGE